MNWMLADAMGFLNIVVAVILIVGGAIAGAAMSGTSPMFPAGTGAVIGLLGGGLYAFLICGLMAVHISIYETLKEIRHSLSVARPVVPDGRPERESDAP